MSYIVCLFEKKIYHYPVFISNVSLEFKPIKEILNGSTSRKIHGTSHRQEP